VRYLMQINMLQRDPVPGSRLIRYRLPDDAWYEVTATKNELFKTLADLADEGATALGGPGTPSSDRVTQMRDYFVFVHDELPRILQRWRAFVAQRERIGVRRRTEAASTGPEAIVPGSRDGGTGQAGTRPRA
jgi:hypothetical protein